MIRLAIVDDNQDTLEFLREKISTRYGEQLCVSTISSVDEFRGEVEAETSGIFDIIVMAIVMGDKSGIELANDYLNRNKRAKLIFITAYAELAQDIFRSKPIGLLHKPINEDKLYETIDRALEKHEEEMNEYITIETKSQIYNMPLSDIRYVESVGHYLMINSVNGTLSVNMKLSEFEDLVSKRGVSYTFIRCHQSFTVNARHIASLASNSIFLRDNSRIPVSRNKQAKARDLFLDYMGNTV